MKNVKIYIIAIFFIPFLFLACEKSNEMTMAEEEIVTAKTNVFGFELSKELNIFDGRGNSATILVFTDDESIYANLEEDAFELVTTTKDMQLLSTEDNSTEVENEVPQSSENILKRTDEKLIIRITGRNLRSDVTGFFVRPKKNLAQQRDTGWGYIYGSGNIDGAAYLYQEESCPGEKMQGQLWKRNSYGWDYTLIGSTTVYHPGFTSFLYTNSSSYWYYIAKARFVGNCGTGYSGHPYFIP